MKKVYLILAALVILTITAVMVFSPVKAVSQKKISQTSISIPDSVAVILGNSCSGCHGDGGSGMAMSKWNISVWDTYSAKKQAKKANAICNSITNGSMPPGSVKKANPEMIPTASQLAIVCKWAASLKGK